MLVSRSILNNEKGLAMIETVPLLVIFVVLMSFGVGLFGAVHTAVLNSIGARTYMFETFRQRANLYYFRENTTALTRGPMNFTKKGWRYQAVTHETDPRELFVPTARPIALGTGVTAESTSSEVHNQQIFDLLPRNERVAVNPIWVMVGYGICLNAKCGN